MIRITATRIVEELSSRLRLRVSPGCFWSRTHGASSIEYALIIAGVALAIISAVGILGGQVTDTFQEFHDDVEKQKDLRR